MTREESVGAKGDKGDEGMPGEPGTSGKCSTSLMFQIAHSQLLCVINTMMLNHPVPVTLHETVKHMGIQTICLIATSYVINYFLQS